MTPQQLYIGGTWRTAAASLPVINPSDGQVMAHIARGTAADVDDAVRAGQAALDGAINGAMNGASDEGPGRAAAAPEPPAPAVGSAPASLARRVPGATGADRPRRRAPWHPRRMPNEGNGQ